MKDSDGTLVFVEVRQRARPRFGGAAASVDWRKRQRIVRGGRYYLMRFEHAPACRFDVVALEGASLQWIQAAFDAQESGF
jgi:putative endonuclease